jgi:murein DD-endopeptidase
MTSTSTSLADVSGKNRPPRKRRGLLDMMLAVALCYGVYAKTPIGAVAETAVRVAQGQKDRPSWFATFKGRETDVKPPPVEATTLSTDSALPASVLAAAEKHKVDVDALAALVAVRGACDAAGKCTLTAPDRLAFFAPGKSGTVDVDAVAAGLAAAVKTTDAVGSVPASYRWELAVEALFVGATLPLAVAQAQKSGLAAPVDVEVHAPFYSPATRRGPLQGALSVLLVQRLRTLAWPASGFRITSPFGERIHPVTGLKSFHNGTDIGTPVGTALLSAHHGSIKRASKDSISGNFVIVDHGLGVQTTYCHMDAFSIAEKDHVERAAVLGASGATGRITGPHLHYILRINDKAVDAEQYGQSPTRTLGLTPVVPEAKKPTPVPDGKKPDGKKPDGKKPDGKKPDGKTPAQPEDTKPDDAKPSDAKPSDAPSNTKPSDAKPEDTAPKNEFVTPETPPSTSTPTPAPSTTDPATTPPAPTTEASP